MSTINNNWIGQIHIDHTATEPLFLQVKEHLAGLIETGLRDGSLSPGDRIPSERELGQGLNVSSITVKRALNELQQEGLIQRIQGRGSFIASPKKLMLGFDRLYSLTSVALERGMAPSRKSLLLEQQLAKEKTAHHLNIDPGDPVACLIRLRLIDGIPLAVDTSYLPMAIFPTILEQDFNAHPLYDVMSNIYRVEPIRAREYLEPTLINEYEARVLSIPVGAPAMLSVRVAYGPNDIPLEFNKCVLRGDMCRFYVDMLKKNL